MRRPLPGFDPGVQRYRGAKHQTSVPPYGSPELSGRSPAERSDPAVLIQKTYDLTLWIFQRVEKFPRSLRFTLGDRVLAAALDLLQALTEARYSTDSRLNLLVRADQQANLLRVLLRLAADLRALPANSREFAAERLEEIGRQAGGWRKSVSAASGLADPPPE